jgi:phospholipid/cholesterol/gamma-HCH transport system ATP-binding protein
LEKHKIIQVRDLTVGYGTDIILKNISFDVLEGEIFIVLGGSGCGKSTLLKHLIGLISPLSGQILIDGEDISNCDETTFKKILRKIGVLYQSSALFGSMTIAENVSLNIKEYTD